MNSSLPIFTLCALACVVGAIAALSTNAEPTSDIAGAPSNAQPSGATAGPPAVSWPSSAAAGATKPSGRALLDEAARTLARYPTFEARVRQRAELFGHSLIGSGVYQQQGAGLDALVRIELRMGGTDQTSSLLQVGDGRFFWTHVDLGGNATLRRVDVERVRAAARRAAAGQGRGATPPTLSLGGLPKLLESLAGMFAWAEPLTVELDRRPAWLVRGNWSRDRLAALLPDQAAAIKNGQNADLSKLPAHLPDQIVVLIGRDDHLVYRIEYRRGASAEEAKKPDAALAPRLLLSMEFFEIRLAQPIDPHQFQYQPGEQSVFDETDRYLSALEPKQK